MGRYTKPGLQSGCLRTALVLGQLGHGPRCMCLLPQHDPLLKGEKKKMGESYSERKAQKLSKKTKVQ